MFASKHGRAPSATMSASKKVKTSEAAAETQIIYAVEREDGVSNGVSEITVSADINGVGKKLCLRYIIVDYMILTSYLATLLT